MPPPAQGVTLVTGGAGFVGANLVRALITRGQSVRVVDDLSAGQPAYLSDLEPRENGSLEVLHGSFMEPSVAEQVVRGVDAVVHLAAMSGVAPSVQRPERDFEVNVRGTFTLLDAARRAGVRRVVFASSGAVLAGAEPPLHEGRPASPLAPYGASKLYGEGLVRSFDSTYGMTGLVLRFSNLYGPFSWHKKSVVAAFLRAALAGGPLTIYGSGEQTRDFLHVEDVVKAVLAGLDARGGGVYQLGTGRETAVLELARMVCEVAGAALRLEHRPPRTAEAARNVTDPSRAAGDLGWRARIGLREGLSWTLRWMEWWSRRQGTDGR